MGSTLVMGLNFQGFRRFRGQSGQSGMTLVEVVITLGIASGLVLAIMEAITFTNKSVKNASISNEWTSVLSNVRLLMADQVQCTGNFAGAAFRVGTYNGDASSPAVAPDTNSPNILKIYKSDGSYLQDLLKVGVKTGNITPTDISIIIPPSNVTAAFSDNSGNYWKDTIQLNITAQKIIGTAAATFLNSPPAAPAAITFSVLRSTTTGAVVKCLGDSDLLASACLMLGGSYDNASPSTVPSVYKCRLKDMFFGTDTTWGPPTTTSGERIQLKSALATGATPDVGQGLRNTGDFSIGVDSTQMWFNAGTAAGGTSFQWTNKAGANNLMQLDDSGGNSTLFLGKGSAANTVLNMGNTEKVQSNRTGGSTNSYTNTSGLDFITGGAIWTPLQVYNNGTVASRFGAGIVAPLLSSWWGVDIVAPGWFDALTLVGDLRMDPYTAYVGAVSASGNVSASSVNATTITASGALSGNTLSVANQATVNGRFTVNAGADNGSNVPHGIWYSPGWFIDNGVTGPGYRHTHPVVCASGFTHAISGGCVCSGSTNPVLYENRRTAVNEWSCGCMSMAAGTMRIDTEAICVFY